MNPNVPILSYWTSGTSAPKYSTWKEHNSISATLVNENLSSIRGKIKDIQHDAPLICLFFIFIFIMYKGYRYVRCQMKRLNFHIKLLQLHSDSTFIYNEDNCPICLSEFKAPVRVSCGHAFCIFCLLKFCIRNTYEWKCMCPLCRNLIVNIKCLHKYNFCQSETELIKKAERQLNKLIKRQNHDISFVQGIARLGNNKWKIIISIVTTVIIIWASLKYQS